MMHDGKDKLIEALKAANEEKDRMIAALMDDLEDRTIKFNRIESDVRHLQKWIQVLTQTILEERRQK